MEEHGHDHFGFGNFSFFMCVIQIVILLPNAVFPLHIWNEMVEMPPSSAEWKRRNNQSQNDVFFRFVNRCQNYGDKRLHERSTLRLSHWKQLNDSNNMSIYSLVLIVPFRSTLGAQDLPPKSLPPKSLKNSRKVIPYPTHPLNNCNSRKLRSHDGSHRNWWKYRNRHFTQHIASDKQQRSDGYCVNRGGRESTSISIHVQLGRKDVLHQRRLNSDVNDNPIGGWNRSTIQGKRWHFSLSQHLFCILLPISNSVSLASHRREWIIRTHSKFITHFSLLFSFQRRAIIGGNQCRADKIDGFIMSGILCVLFS